MPVKVEGTRVGQARYQSANSYSEPVVPKQETKGSLIVYTSMTLQDKDKAYATFNIQQFSHPVFLEDGITDMRLVDKRLVLLSSKSTYIIVTGSKKVFLLRNIAIDKDIMQVQVPKQNEALTVAANEDMAIISSSKWNTY